MRTGLNKANPLISSGVFCYRSFCSIDGNDCTCVDPTGSFFRSDNTWDAQFATHDGGVARDAAFVGDNGSGFFHKGDEFGARHACHEDFASLKCVEVVTMEDDAGFAGDGAGARGLAFEDGVVLEIFAEAAQIQFGFDGFEIGFKSEVFATIGGVTVDETVGSFLYFGEVFFELIEITGDF